MKEKLRDQKWFPYAVAACIAVVLYVALTHLNAVFGAVGTFLGYFRSIFMGCVLAYLMNPLAKLYQRSVLRKVRKEKLCWTLATVLALLTLLLFLVFIVGTLVPQLAASARKLINNMDSYMASLQALLKQWGLTDKFQLNELIGSPGSLMDTLTSYVLENANSILDFSAAAGKVILNWVISLILSVYLLLSKESLKRGVLRLLAALLPKKPLESVVGFFSRCDKILVRYIIFTLLDALIVGVANAIFMFCFDMQYVGLVSMVVAVTNVIPTFGPIIGGIIGGFILLLVNPLHALFFIIFTLILQFMDGYVIKPKLFGDSLGVSGLLILAGVIVFGNMFGILGILFAIPIAAILDFVYEEELLPALEKRRGKK